MWHRVINAAPLIHRSRGGTSKITSHAARWVVLMKTTIPPRIILWKLSNTFLELFNLQRGDQTAAPPPRYRAISPSLAPVPKFRQRPFYKPSRLAWYSFMPFPRDFSNLTLSSAWYLKSVYHKKSFHKNLWKLISYRISVCPISISAHVVPGIKGKTYYMCPIRNNPQALSTESITKR